MAHTASLGAPAPDTTTDDEITSMALMDFEPSLTMEQLDQIEANYNETWGVKRRITLLALTRSKAELVLNLSKSDNGIDVAMEMIDHVHAFRDHLRDGIALAEAASARLLITCSALMSTEGA